MTHELESMPSGLWRCAVCGALFWRDDLLTTIEAKPCTPAPDVIVPLDCDPPRILYSLPPLPRADRIDDKGAALLDGWLNEWRKSP